MSAPTSAPPTIRRRLLGALPAVGCLAALLFVQMRISPLSLLTTYPAVYQDEYLLMGAAVSLAEGLGPIQGPSASTPRLSELLDGEGNITPGIQVGYSLALSTWFRLFGIGIVQARAFSYAMGLTMVLGVFWLGRRWWGLWAGLCASLLLLVDPTFWYTSRQVRPEAFTVACYLASAVLVSLRSERWRNRLAEVAGLLLGAGMTGHPCGVVAVPVVLGLMWLGWRESRSWRYLARFLVPAIVIVGAYAIFLTENWSGVREVLGVHSTGRELKPKPLLEKVDFERNRYLPSGGYQNSFTHFFKWKRAVLVGWGLLAVSLLVAFWRRKDVDRAKWAVFAAGFPAIAVVLALLTSDNNYLYMMNVAPWLYLSGAAGVVALATLLLRANWTVLRRAAAVAGCVAVVLLARRAIRDYSKDLAPYAGGEILAYEEIEAQLAERIPAGALVLGNQSAWLAAKRAGAEYLFNELQVQWSPPYRLRPVRSRIENTHLVEYTFDFEVLRAVEGRGTPVYFVADMWDWGWNCYYPYHQYAARFLELEQTLAAHFTPVVRLWTRDRGFITLYKFDEQAQARPAASSIVYVERKPFRVGREVTAAPPVKPGPIAAPALPLTTYPLEAGRHYWFHAEIGLPEGGYAIPAWNHASLAKWAGSPESVPLDTFQRATDSQGTLSLYVYPTPRPVQVDRMVVRELIPAEAELVREGEPTRSARRSSAR